MVFTLNKKQYLLHCLIIYLLYCNRIHIGDHELWFASQRDVCEPLCLHSSGYIWYDVTRMFSWPSILCWQSYFISTSYRSLFRVNVKTYKNSFGLMKPHSYTAVCILLNTTYILQEMIYADRELICGLQLIRCSIPNYYVFGHLVSHAVYLLYV